MMMTVALRRVAALTRRRVRAVVLQVGKSCARRPLASVHVVLAVTTAAISQTWFSAGRFIAAGDVGPFVREGAARELAWLWNHQTSGAGAASTEIARTFEVMVSVVVTSVGLGDVAAQRVLYAMLLVGAALGTAWFAGAFTRRPLVVGLAGLLGVINPLVLISSFNPVLIAPIGVLGGLAGCVLRAAHGRRVSPAAVGMLSIATSYLALNPPTLAMTLLSVVVLAVLGRPLAGPGGTRRAVTLLVRATPWMLVCNLWWLVPYGIALSGTAADVQAVTDIGAWSWTHVNNRVWDVAALNAHWTWTHDEYLPVAATLDRPPWIWLRYMLPAVALSTPLVAQPTHRRRALVAVSCALVLVVVGKGTHEPFGHINVWMYEHVPGFWLLREPLNKVGPTLLLCYVLLVVVWLESVRARLALSRPRWLRTLPAVVALAMLVYPWPVVTGDVIRDDSGPLPAARVALPEGWRTVADLIDAHDSTGKALVLPLSSYYQVETTWGYQGTDALMTWLLDRPVLQRQPGGYFGEDAQFEQLLIDVERALVSRRFEAALRIMQSLGVSHVVVRRDLVPDRSGQGVATTDELSGAARTAGGLTLVRRTSVADVFTVDAPYGEAVTVYGAAANAGTGDASAMVDVLPASTALVTAQDAPLGGSAVAAFTHETAADGASVDVSVAGDYDVVAGGSSWWRVGRDGRHVTLEPQDAIAVNGAVSTIRQPIALDVGRGGAAMVADSGRQLEAGQLVALEDGTRVVGLALDGRTRPRPAGAVGDCNAVDDRTLRDVGIGGAVRAGRVALQADAHSACVHIPLDVDATTPFALQLDMRRSAGAPARACVWQVGPDTCAPVNLTADTDDWSQRRVVVDPAPRTSAVELYLYADGRDDGSTTRTAYRDIELTRFVTRSETTVAPPPTRRVRLDAGTHELSVARPESQNRLGPWSSLRSCGGDLDDGARVATIRGGVQLRAADQAACVVAPVRGARADTYVVELEYRSRQGHAPRMCVWQVGPDTCAVTPELAAGDAWHRLRTTIRPHPDARDLQLYLYADGFGDGGTVTEYRDVKILEAVPQRVAVRPAGAASAPTMLATRRSPAEYAVEVGDATDRFVMGLADSYDDRWVLRGLPHGWSATHVEVDGYANGWVVERTSDDAPTRLHLTIEHRPSVLVRWLLLLPVVAAITSLARRRVRRARPASELRGDDDVRPETHA